MCRKFKFLFSFVLVLGIVLTSVASTADPSLVGWWKFDESSGNTAIDSSGNGFDIRLHNTTWEDGVFGGAVHFHGVGYGDVGNFKYSDNAITVCAWVWHDAFRIGEIERYVTVGSEVAVIRKDSKGRLHFYIKTDGNLRHLRVTDVPTEGQWHHVAGTWDGLTQRLYIDGLEIASQALSGVLGNTSNVILSSGGGPFNGMLDEVRIYNRAMTQEEIQFVMQRKEWPFAFGPSPADGALHQDTWASLEWWAGAYAVSHDVYFGDNFDDVNEGTGGTFQGNQTTASFRVGSAQSPYLVPGTTYYWRIDEVNDLHPDSPWKGNVWIFTVPPKKAYHPNPPDGGKCVGRNVTLSWTPGFGAKLHHVYFGDEFANVNDADTSDTVGVYRGVQAGTTYTPGPLELEETYHWRVDEFDDSGTHKGNVWSFKVVEGFKVVDGTAVWFHPSVYSNDYYDLYDPDFYNQWAEVQSKIDVIDFSWEKVRNASDDEMKNIVGFLGSHPRIKLSFIGPVIKEFDCTAELHAFNKNNDAIVNVTSHGGEVTYWYVDESGFRAMASCGDEYQDWHGINPHDWRQILDIAAEYHEALSAQLQEAHPNLIIGVDEPYPAMTKEQHFYWIDKLVAMDDCHISFYHNGIDAEAIKVGKGDLSEIKEIMDYARSKGLEYGHMLKGAGSSDYEYYQYVFDWCPQVQQAVGPPDHAVFQHWGSWSPQYNLPEDVDYSYTQLVRDYLRRWYTWELASEMAWNPNPGDGATGVTQTPILRWRAGDKALLHDVYLGAEQTALADADTTTTDIYRGRQALTRHTPAEDLKFGRTYYWRVDEYNTDATISKGRVWSFTTAFPEPLSEALDTALSFTTGGSADWFAQNTTSRYDGDAAQSEDISHSQDSWMQTTVSGTGTVKFYWKVSSEEDFDFLEFYIDGSLQEKISGLVNWEHKTYTISTSGSHTLEWRYMKDGSVDYGSDCGWVDKVEWVAN